jgi:MarR family transcriptional regulator, transcriptional regulator for hemolysin
VAAELFLDRVDHLTRRLQRNLECCDRALVGCCGLTVAQSYAMLALQELGTVTMNEFAAEMRLHGTTMTRMVDALIDKGMVERRPDPEDRRIVRVALSPAGQEMAGKLQEAKRQLLSAELADFSASEQGMILKALERMAEVLEKLSVQCCG